MSFAPGAIRGVRKDRSRTMAPRLQRGALPVGRARGLMMLLARCGYRSELLTAL